LLDEVGLASALQWYAEGFAERSKIEVRLEIPADFGRLPNDIELTIFRIVQECLTNIHRHSGSAAVTIRVERGDGRVALKVQDHGKGIPEERLRELVVSGRSGVGFGGMRERLRHLGGTLDIQSDRNGTVVTAILQVGQKAAS